MYIYIYVWICICIYIYFPVEYQHGGILLHTADGFFLQIFPLHMLWDVNRDRTQCNGYMMRIYWMSIWTQISTNLRTIRSHYIVFLFLYLNILWRSPQHSKAIVIFWGMFSNEFSLRDLFLTHVLPPTNCWIAGIDMVVDIFFGNTTMWSCPCPGPLGICIWMGNWSSHRYVIGNINGDK